jgi:hypothetical protein
LLGAGDLRGLFGDARKRLLEVESAHDHTGRPEQCRELVCTTDRRVMGLGVLQRDGDLVGEQLENVEIGLSERAVLAASDAERADDPITEQDRLSDDPAGARHIENDPRD